MFSSKLHAGAEIAMATLGSMPAAANASTTQEVECSQGAKTILGADKARAYTKFVNFVIKNKDFYKPDVTGNSAQSGATSATTQHISRRTLTVKIDTGLFGKSCNLSIGPVKVELSKTEMEDIIPDSCISNNTITICIEENQDTSQIFYVNTGPDSSSASQKKLSITGNVMDCICTNSPRDLRKIVITTTKSDRETIEEKTMNHAGATKNNIPHGKGTLTISDTEVLVCDFNNGKPVLDNVEKFTYRGREGWTFAGRMIKTDAGFMPLFGTQTHTNGAIYSGNFSGYKLSGIGSIEDSTGRKVVGEFSKGVFDTSSEATFTATLVKYVGLFRLEEASRTPKLLLALFPHGQGSFTSFEYTTSESILPTKDRPNMRVVIGVFKDGEIDPNTLETRECFRQEEGKEKVLLYTSTTPPNGNGQRIATIISADRKTKLTGLTVDGKRDGTWTQTSNQGKKIITFSYNDGKLEMANVTIERTDDNEVKTLFKGNVKINDKNQPEPHGHGTLQFSNEPDITYTLQFRNGSINEEELAIIEKISTGKKYTYTGLIKIDQDSGKPIPAQDHEGSLTVVRDGAETETYTGSFELVKGKFRQLSTADAVANGSAETDSQTQNQ